MKKSQYSEEQIAYTLRQAGAGVPVAELCRKLGIAEATFYLWKQKDGDLGKDVRPSFSLDCMLSGRIVNIDIPVNVYFTTAEMKTKRFTFR